MCELTSITGRRVLPVAGCVQGLLYDRYMAEDKADIEPGPSAQAELRDRGLLPCEIGQHGISAAPLDSRFERVIEATTGERFVVSVPRGLRSPCFGLDLPSQRALAATVIGDVDALADRIGPGNPAKGIGIAANQSASLVTLIAQLAANEVAEPSLRVDQRKASIDSGAVPAFFRYQDPTGNIIRVFNPSDATTREKDGSYAVETDLRAEGCLSSIEFRGRVIRPLTMVVDGQDLDGNRFRITARGPAARLLGHEVSHVTRGLAGLCVIEGGLPVFTLDEYERLGTEVVEWHYGFDFTVVPYLELSDPTNQLEPPELRSRLTDQGLFTPIGDSSGNAGQ
jgi:peptide deformylase